MDTAKIFWSGRSQAVRLPKEFRFDSDTVRIRRHGNSVILEPIASDWLWLDRICGNIDDDFIEWARENVELEEKPELDKFFDNP